MEGADQLLSETERTVIVYSELWSTSKFFLASGRETETGSFHMFLASLAFSSFAFEAFLNHIGEAKILCWKDIEQKLSPKQKVMLLCENLGIPVDFGVEPWKIIGKIQKFRNALVHAKNETLTDEKYVTQEEVDQANIEMLTPEWMNLATEENAVHYREQLEALFKIIFDAAGIEGDVLFNRGVQLSSLSKPSS